MQRTATTPAEGKILLDKAALAKKIHGLAQAIAKEFGKNSSLVLVGVQTRGVPIARRIAALLEKEWACEVPVGILDITLYRDDVHAIAEQPEVKETDLPFEIDDRPLVLIDDVLFTGRTVRSAMNAIIDYGRPRCIRLAVLVDRGHRELPVAANFVGLAVDTQREDIIDVNLQEADGEDAVRLRKKGKTG